MNFTRFVVPMLTALFGIGAAQADPSHRETLLVEVFTTTDREVRWKPVIGPKEVHQQNITPFIQSSTSLSIGKKSIRESVLAEPFPWTVAQGVTRLLR